MKIGFCQFEPKFKDPDANFATINEWTEDMEPGDVDVLMLPEMGFTGYTFKDLDDIRPFLESHDGRTVQWCQRTARRLNAWVVAGFPSTVVENGAPKYYNSMCVVDRTGAVVTIYHKHFLFEKDERWAHEGPSFRAVQNTEFGTVGFGICMDLNPRQFKTDWYLMEFANFHATKQSKLILCCMAWLRPKDEPADSDETNTTMTIPYWIERLRPLDGSNTTVVICNRTGGGAAEEGARFCGHSCVIRFHKDAGVEVGHCGENDGLFVFDLDAFGDVDDDNDE
ncbi:Carbon-nitrogen hydrolase [Allomyces javanicus]|nr:Carbon-nitrogen hydrolase [Allomyces javanicus]